MSVLMKLARYTVRDVLRSRWLVGYALVLAVITDTLLRFNDTPAKALLGMVNVVLLVVPAVSLIVGAMLVYSRREFTELLLAQPIRRHAFFMAQYVGTVAPISAAYAAGVALPFVLHGAAGSAGAALGALVGTGVALTWIFGAIAQVIALRCEDRVRGLAITVAVWLALTILYDGLVLSLAITFHEYPLEWGLVGLLVANPVDLARLALLLQLDVAALMGYTGAVFRSFFGSASGLGIALGALAFWVIVPLSLGLRSFARKDF